MYFSYGETEIAYLKKKDKRLGVAIDKIGLLQRPVHPDLFSAIVRQIVAQQISTKAQRTIWLRMQAELTEVTVETVCKTDSAALQQLGISFRKAEYIKSFAEKIKCGDLDLAALAAKSDQEVVAALSSLKGIGVWTAEMMLLFCLQRPDVLSFGDLAIHRGLRMLYGHKVIDQARFARYRRRYSPYGSVASLYLWAIAGGAIDGLVDRAAKKPVKNN